MNCTDVSKFYQQLTNHQEPVVLLNELGEIQKINPVAQILINLDNKLGNIRLLSQELNDEWFSLVKNVKKEGFYIYNTNILYAEKLQSTKLIATYDALRKVILIWFVETQRSEVCKMQSILNSVGQAVFITDNYGNIVELNQEVIGIIERPKKVIMNQTFEQLLIDFNIPHQHIHLFFSEVTNEGKGKIIVEKRKGSQVFLYELITMLDHRLNLFVTTFKDVTLEFELQYQAEQQLLHEINETVATIAHEIRNPMTSLKGFLDLLKVNMKESDETYFSIIDAEFERLDMILDEILYLAKPLKAQVQSFSLRTIIEEVIDLMQPFALQQNVLMILQVEQYETFLLNCKENRMKQLLINMIKNAIESMTLGGTITLSLQFDESGDILLRIQDEGIGMNRETKDALFTPFYTTKRQGTGLGLPLVKKIVEEHQGEVSVYSQLGEGTKFTFRFPRYKHVPLKVPTHSKFAHFPTLKRS